MTSNQKAGGLEFSVSVNTQARSSIAKKLSSESDEAVVQRIEDQMTANDSIRQLANIVSDMSSAPAYRHVTRGR